MDYLRYTVALGLGWLLGIGVMLVAMALPPSTIQVDVHNSSGQTVSQVTIILEEGTVSIHNLAPGVHKIVPILINGESSYNIRATLANDMVVEAEERYVEPGYRLRETITSTGIEHEFKSFY